VCVGDLLPRRAAERGLVRRAGARVLLTGVALPLRLALVSGQILEHVARSRDRKHDAIVLASVAAVEHRRAGGSFVAALSSDSNGTLERFRV